MRENNIFAATVHRLCREQGLTVREVAKQSTYSESYVSKVLNGHRPLKPDLAGRLDDALEAGGELKRIAAQQFVTGEHVRPRQLPPPVSDFVGRQEYLRRLDDVLAARDVEGSALAVVIEGGFWTGKTELAVQWASQVQDRFPGGCLFVDLHGLAPGRSAQPGAVLDGFLRALGAPNSELQGTKEERAARFRSRLADRPAIVILDNAADYRQLQPLLPGPGSMLLVTSREHQGALLTQTGAAHIELPPLTSDEALDLLRRRVGGARVDADTQAAEKMVRCAARLPMAVRIAAEYAVHHGHTLYHVAELLRAVSGRLDLFTSMDPAVNIRTVLDLSYLALPPQPARIFRLLGGSAAPLISPESAAALGGITVPDAVRALEVLHRAHLVDLTDHGRMRMNHLVRAYAHERAEIDEPPRELERAHRRHLHWYAASAHSAGNALAPNWAGMRLVPGTVADVEPLSFGREQYDRAMTWFEVEADAILRMARSVTTGDLGWMLPAMLLPYFYLTKDWQRWLTAAADGKAAAVRAHSRVGNARSLLSLGWVQHEVGHTEDAILLLTTSLQLQADFENEGDRDPLLEGWTAFALASAHASLRHTEQAYDLYRRAERLFAAAGLDFGVAVSRAMLAGEQHQLGDVEEATESAYNALELAKVSKSKPAVSLAHHQLGLLLMQHGAYRPALTHLDEALKLRRAGRERWGEADTLTARAETLGKLGQPRTAREAYREAADILKTLHSARAFDIQTQIATLNAVLNAPPGPGEPPS